MADVVENKENQGTAATPVQTPTASVAATPVVATSEETTEAQQTDVDKAKALESKTDEELAEAQEKLSNALAALPEATEGLLASARSALSADLDLIQAEIKSRTDQAVDTVQEAVNSAGSDLDSFWDKYGSKINEGAKWAVLAAIVYRLFIF